jgi:cell division septation protein DedD
MPKNEDGEFELVVGNKQLLSIVFIMMVLFGVVFSMGYFVGRNSAPEPAATASLPPDEARPAAAGAPLPPAADAGPLAPGDAQVVAGGTRPVAAEPEQAQPAEPEPQSAAETKAEAGPPAASGRPEPGQTFLQVAAVRRPEAELIVDVLKKKGFQALVAPVIVDGHPSDLLYRALVGPLKDGSDLARTKSELETAGFKPIVRRY